MEMGIPCSVQYPLNADSASASALTAEDHSSRVPVARSNVKSVWSQAGDDPGGLRRPRRPEQSHAVCLVDEFDRRVGEGIPPSGNPSADPDSGELDHVQPFEGPPRVSRRRDAIGERLI